MGPAAEIAARITDHIATSLGTAEGFDGVRRAMDLIEDCPVLYPTEEEFGNFEKYVSSIGKRERETGLVKIVPPVTWNARQSYECIESGQLDFPIRTPIEQLWVGQRGVYRQADPNHPPR